MPRGEPTTVVRLCREDVEMLEEIASRLDLTPAQSHKLYCRRNLKRVLRTLDTNDRHEHGEPVA